MKQNKPTLKERVLQLMLDGVPRHKTQVSRAMNAMPSSTAITLNGLCRDGVLQLIAGKRGYYQAATK